MTKLSHSFRLTDYATIEFSTDTVMCLADSLVTKKVTIPLTIEVVLNYNNHLERHRVITMDVARMNESELWGVIKDYCQIYRDKLKEIDGKLFDISTLLSRIHKQITKEYYAKVSTT